MLLRILCTVQNTSGEWKSRFSTSICFAIGSSGKQQTLQHNDVLFTPVGSRPTEVLYGTLTLLMIVRISVYYLQYVYIWIVKRMWLVISTIFSKTKAFSRSQPVMYTVNVAMSRKRCKIESLLLAYRLLIGIICGLSNSRDSSDLEIIHLMQAFSNIIFRTAICNNWQVFKWRSASLGPFVIAELRKIEDIFNVSMKIVLLSS